MTNIACQARLAGPVLVLLAALLGIGCASSVPPNIHLQPPEIPEAWMTVQSAQTNASEASAEDLTAWWRQLGDPVLDELVDRIVSQNLDLQVAGARVTEVRARRGLSRAELGPSISAGISAGRSESLGEGFDSDSFSMSLDTAWEADLFGAKRRSLAASQADFEASIEDVRAVRVSLVAETVVAYADLRVAEARLRVVDDSLASRQETYQLTDWREQAGLASQLEASQALSSLEQARTERPLLEQSATEARLRLALLAGESPGALDDLLAKPEVAEIPRPPTEVFAGIPADTLNQRPDVRSAERTLEAALARLDVAQAARYPTLRLTGSLDGQSPDAGNLFDVDSFFANLLAGLTAPIFESGRIRENIVVRDAQVEQAALSYHSTVLQALSEVESALSFFQRSQERIARLDDAIQAAEEAAELADQRYEGGLVDLLSVLDTERTLFNLEEQRVTAQGELVSAFSNLYRALGGGWDSESQTSAVQGDSNA